MIFQLSWPPFLHPILTLFPDQGVPRQPRGLCRRRSRCNRGCCSHCFCPCSGEGGREGGVRRRHGKTLHNLQLQLITEQRSRFRASDSSTKYIVVRTSAVVYTRLVVFVVVAQIKRKGRLNYMRDVSNWSWINVGYRKKQDDAFGGECDDGDNIN